MVFKNSTNYIGKLYQPAPANPENLAFMRLLDEQYLRTPFYGSRRMTVWLQSQGYAVNRKRVQRLLQVMGWGAFHLFDKLKPERAIEIGTTMSQYVRYIVLFPLSARDLSASVNLLYGGLHRP